MNKKILAFSLIAATASTLSSREPIKHIKNDRNFKDKKPYYIKWTFGASFDTAVRIKKPDANLNLGTTDDPVFLGPLGRASAKHSPFLGLSIGRQLTNNLDINLFLIMNSSASTIVYELQKNNELDTVNEAAANGDSFVLGVKALYSKKIKSSERVNLSLFIENGIGISNTYLTSEDLRAYPKNSGTSFYYECSFGTNIKNSDFFETEISLFCSYGGSKATKNLIAETDKLNYGNKAGMIQWKTLSFGPRFSLKAKF